VVVIENIGGTWRRRTPRSKRPLKGAARSAPPRIDHAIADRCVHSAVPDGRICRIALSRIRNHGERGVVLSLLISRTSPPMMCARLLKPESKEHGWLYRFFERGFDGLLNLYERRLRSLLPPSLHHPDDNARPPSR